MDPFKVNNMLSEELKGILFFVLQSHFLNGMLNYNDHVETFCVICNVSSKKGIGLHCSTSLLLPIAWSSLGMTFGVTVGLSDVLNEI